MKIIGISETVHLFNASPKAMLLATLPEAEYADEHIPDSHRLDCDSQDCFERIRTLLHRVPAGTPLILYGRDSDDDVPARTAYRLETEGFATVHIFGEGLAGWRAMGYALAGSGREDHFGLGFEANEAMHHGDWPTKTSEVPR